MNRYYKSLLEGYDSVSVCTYYKNKVREKAKREKLPGMEVAITSPENLLEVCKSFPKRNYQLEKVLAGSAHNGTTGRDYSLYSPKLHRHEIVFGYLNSKFNISKKTNDFVLNTLLDLAIAENNSESLPYKDAFPVAYFSEYFGTYLRTIVSYLRDFEYLLGSAEINRVLDSFKEGKHTEVTFRIGLSQNLSILKGSDSKFSEDICRELEKMFLGVKADFGDSIIKLDDKFVDFVYHHRTQYYNKMIEMYEDFALGLEYTTEYKEVLELIWGIKLKAFKVTMDDRSYYAKAGRWFTERYLKDRFPEFSIVGRGPSEIRDMLIGRGVSISGTPVSVSAKEGKCLEANDYSKFEDMDLFDNTVPSKKGIYPSGDRVVEAMKQTGITEADIIKYLIDNGYTVKS